MTKREAFESIINILDNSSYPNEIAILQKELANLDTRNAASAKLRAKKSESKTILRNDLYNLIKNASAPLTINDLLELLPSNTATFHQIAYQLRVLCESNAITKERSSARKATIYFIPSVEETSND